MTPLPQRRQQPGRDLRIDRVQIQYLIRHETVSRPVGGVEPELIARAEGTDQGTYLVRIAGIERAVIQQGHDIRKGLRQRRCRLDREPFVEDQRIIAPALVKRRQRLVPLRTIDLGQEREGRDRIRHVVGAPELSHAKLARRPVP